MLTEQVKIWSPRTDLNRQPADYKSAALPLCYVGNLDMSACKYFLSHFLRVIKFWEFTSAQSSRLKVESSPHPYPIKSGLWISMLHVCSCMDLTLSVSK